MHCQVHAGQHDAGSEVPGISEISHESRESRFPSFGYHPLDYHAGHSNIKSTFYSRSPASRSMSL